MSTRTAINWAGPAPLCAAEYPYLPVICDLAYGHAGPHEDHAYDAPATLTWED